VRFRRHLMVSRLVIACKTMIPYEAEVESKVRCGVLNTEEHTVLIPGLKVVYELRPSVSLVGEN